MVKINLEVGKRINKTEVEKEVEAKEITVSKIRFLLMDCTLDLIRPIKLCFGSDSSSRSQSLSFFIFCDLVSNIHSHSVRSHTLVSQQSISRH